MEAILFLTGTINPEGMSQTVLLDSETRMKQYIASLKFYLNKTDLNIVFVENSGIDISSYFTIEEIKRIEFLTFYGNNYDKKLGKGFGEMKIFEYAINNSMFIQNSDLIIKITGRHIIKNINTFIKQAQNSTNRDTLFLDFKRNFKWADSRIFIFNKNFFNSYLLNFKSTINDSEGLFFEHVLRKAAFLAFSDNYDYKPLIDYPVFSGMSGTSGNAFKKNVLFILSRRVLYILKYHIVLR